VPSCLVWPSLFPTHRVFYILSLPCFCTTMDPAAGSLSNTDQPSSSPVSPCAPPPHAPPVAALPDGATASEAVVPTAPVGNQCSPPERSADKGDEVRQPSFSKRTVAVLRAELISNGLSSHGNKDALVGRLRDHYATVTATAVAGPDAAAVASCPVAVPAGVQSPMFTKHEHTRLFHVMAMRNIAEGIVAKKGPLSRQQLDAGAAKHDRWATLVAPHFNNPGKKFVTPACLSAYDLNPNLHPYIRSGTKLKAKFAGVSLGQTTSCFLFSRLAHCNFRRCQISVWSTH